MVTFELVIDKHDVQYTKVTQNLSEFQEFQKNDNKTGLYLEDTIRT